MFNNYGDVKFEDLLGSFKQELNVGDFKRKLKDKMKTKILQAKTLPKEKFIRSLAADYIKIRARNYKVIKVIQCRNGTGII